MIGKLSGILSEKQVPELLIECHGVGYEVQVPMSTFLALGEIGQSVSLFTHLIVREDAHTLFGFLTAIERLVFRQLIRISGVGPRMALAILSGLSLEELGQAIVGQDITRMTKVPGVGKKTAERLLLELKDKWMALMGTQAAGAISPESSAAYRVASDVAQALVALGYSEKEAWACVKKLPEGLEVSAALRFALKALS